MPTFAEQQDLAMKLIGKAVESSAPFKDGKVRTGYVQDVILDYGDAKHSPCIGFHVNFQGEPVTAMFRYDELNVTWFIKKVSGENANSACS